MEGDMKLRPGTRLFAGYDFTLPGNKDEAVVTVADPKVVFSLRCVSGATPSEATLTVWMSDGMYTVTDSAWYPSGDQHDWAVYQGSAVVPDVCRGGAVRFDRGGTFSASLPNDGWGWGSGD
jgi:hypothetical protein